MFASILPIQCEKYNLAEGFALTVTHMAQKYEEKKLYFSTKSTKYCHVCSWSVFKGKWVGWKPSL